mmetsp:Transcript_41527/g.129161  ORF Transcript_41527/g.129161 Transcript_41527/m.129161 type:complete len:241 (-) Transcript_41527:1027-1749(-)
MQRAGAPLRGPRIPAAALRQGQALVPAPRAHSARGPAPWRPGLRDLRHQPIRGLAALPGSPSCRRCAAGRARGLLAHLLPQRAGGVPGRPPRALAPPRAGADEPGRRLPRAPLPRRPLAQPPGGRLPTLPGGREERVLYAARLLRGAPPPALGEHRGEGPGQGLRLLRRASERPGGRGPLHSHGLALHTDQPRPPDRGCGHAVGHTLLREAGRISSCMRHLPGEGAVAAVLPHLHPPGPD